MGNTLKNPIVGQDSTAFRIATGIILCLEWWLSDYWFAGVTPLVD